MPMSGRARKRPQRAQYVKALAMLIVAVGLLGSLGNLWLTREEQGASLPDQPIAVDESSLQAAFQAAVEAMQAGDYEMAVRLWHPLLVAQPALPEIKVNMGFSLYELGRYRTALDFFSEALAQNAYQANAYYGQAICFEKLGDLELALGAMRSYIHLAGAEENPRFIRKARAALWEWQSAREGEPEPAPGSDELLQ